VINYRFRDIYHQGDKMQLPITSHRIRLMQAMEAKDISLLGLLHRTHHPETLNRFLETPAILYSPKVALTFFDLSSDLSTILGVNYAWLARGVGDPFKAATPTPEESSVVAQSPQPNEATHA
jgi:hypothetical protein